MRGEIQMNDAEFDRMLAANILAADGELFPSAEFAASVMAAVQSEAAMNAAMKAPLPILPSTPFPWATALGGLLACLMLAGVTTASLMRMQTQPVSTAPSAQQAQMLPYTVGSLAQSSHAQVDIAWIENDATNLANLAADQGAKLPSLLIQTEQQAANMGVGWLLFALLLGWATVQFSLYLADS